MHFGLKHATGRLVVALMMSAAVPSAYAKVFSFGDSYTDNGNIDVVTGGAQPGPQYWSGRFTNGWTLAERLTFRLTNAAPGRAPGLNSLQYPTGTSAIGGIDFGHGGATAVANSALPKHLSVYNQAAYFRNEVLAKHITVGSADTAIIWAGLNDYLAYNATNAKTVSGNVTDRILPLVIAAKVSNILVLNLPNMGDLPGWIDGPKRSSLNALTATHNTNLAARLAVRQGLTTSKLILVDINRAMTLAHQGLAGGFTVTRPGQNGSASGNCLGDGKVLSNCPSTYLYYDYVHLTSSGHEYLTSVAADRLNSALGQAKVARLSSTGASAAMAMQSQKLRTRFVTLQESAGAGDGEGASPGLGIFAFGDLNDATAFSPAGEREFGGGADMRWGEWLAGAAAFRVAPGSLDENGQPDLALSQSATGVSAYMGWIAPDAALTVSATHARGDQETERLTTIRGLSVARGKTQFSASAIELSGSGSFAWDAWSIKGEAALRYDDTRVAAFQEQGTLGLSDTVYDAVRAQGVAGRAGVTLGFESEDLSLSLGAHVLSRVSGTAPLEAALPVAIPGFSSTRYDTGEHAPLQLEDRAAAASFAVNWRFDEGANLTFGAAAVASPSGEIEAGLTVGAKIDF